MKGRGRATRVVLRMGLLGLTLAVARAAPPTDSPNLARCAAITAADERLACYDALVCAGIAAADERLACYDALAKPRRSQPQAAPADAAGPGNGAADVKGFGLSQRQLRAVAEGPVLITARVVKVTQDRLGKVEVLLDNGQTWLFNEPDALLRQGDTVTIKRAAFGSFLMRTPAKHSYRVQRVQ